MNLIWPFSEPGAVFAPPPAKPAAAAAAAPIAKEAPPPRPRPTIPASPGRTLPPYTQSLLRIRVPVVVTLAEKRQPLGKVIELGPGTIIQFDKSCEEMLELSVANRPIAIGEAVKVGDKFGLRVTSMTPSDERFQPLVAKRPPAR
jgi:flagellar motor switch/type III secretory pathway protein FliN